MRSNACAKEVAREAAGIMGGRDMRCVGIMLLALLSGCTQASAQDLPPNVAAQLDREFAVMNRQAPIEMGPSHKMTRVLRNGPVVFYSVESAIPQIKWTQEMRERMARETTIVVCADQEIRTLIDTDGLQVRYLFTDQSGLFVTTFAIFKDKCAGIARNSE
jgi:hypothetical protein